MAEIVRMPKLSDTMTEGVVAQWHKKVGDKVKSGELLADIETDKATMEFESFQDGVLLHIGVEKGKSAPVDSILAILGKEGEDISALLKDDGQAAAATAPAAETSAGNKETTPTPAASESKQQAAAPEIPSTVEIVRMPKLSDTMTEGVVAEWHKKVGDKVKSGELLADIQTDKATMEFESFQDGVLLYIGVEKGKSAPVDSVLAILGQGKEDVSAIVAYEKQKGSAPAASSTSETKPAAKEIPATKETAVAAKTIANTAAKTVAQGNNNGRLKASPLAKKIAKDKGITIANIAGSGDGGRVIKRDLDNAINNGSSAAKSFVGTESFTEEAVSQMRKAIARRLSESKFSAPHFYVTMDIDMDEAIKAREVINKVALSKISFNDLVIKAVAHALRQNPKVNSSWLGDKIRYNNHIHIGVAVAVEDGLLVPVVRFADGKTLSQIGNEVKVLAQKAKDKKLQPSEWEGNTFTISNLGMFGVEAFTAIINPPDSCILAIGGIKQVPVVKNGAVVPGNVMKVTLSCDHRVVDGATGAAFLQTFKNLLENPVLLLGANSI